MANSSTTTRTYNCVVFVTLFTWTGIIWHIHQRLQRLEDELPQRLQFEFEWLTSDGTTSSSRDQPNAHRQSHHPRLFEQKRYQDEQGNTLRFLMFQGDITGQGVGNHMQGLLAAHLLGDEFDRIVCVSPAFDDFWLAFEQVHPMATRWCPQVIRDWEARMDDEEKRTSRLRPYNYRRPPLEYTMTLLNFNSRPIDECELQEKLQSNTSVWYLRNNMYPRWPNTVGGNTVIPPRYFERFYKPNRALSKLLPVSPPAVVVHLRKEDGPNDVRHGLDPTSLKALGELLQNGSTNDSQKKPYLVTNNVQWYNYFERTYQWSHPPWKEVIHSVYLSGGGRRHYNHHYDPPSSAADSSPSLSSQDFRDLQKLWMWSDWYTCYTAEAVYHTHSDFSASAIHWKDPSSQSSRVIRGFNSTTQALDLGKEYWRNSGPVIVPPLSQRRSPSELHNCAPPNSQKAHVKVVKSDSTQTHLAISLIRNS
ncbi:expressed unknown protein [Seminavis robusta]|uniref:Uncharacterized protein n=1 Tax=Seminavis robusta TaxID=568900 RepID=A0A9N8F0P5_9STRA|nr:expressed unknown protein [Seminavis robusta]|eukprot:Sro2241_g320360.1 n/a (476) ;mRNA; f:6221-7648